MKALASLFLIVSVLSLNESLAGETELQKHPDVLSVKVGVSGDRVYDFDVTVSSPYDSPERYADAFRLRDADGKVFGERVLLHDHANEQPFTRDLYSVSIPAPTRAVIVEARDRQFGYGGKSVEVMLPER